MLIYCITNSANGKRYVGKTKLTAARRLEQHFKSARCGAEYALACAIRKYGQSSFSVAVVEDHILADEDSRERFWICKFKSLCSEHGYNMTSGGDGISNPSPELRRKMSAALKGRTNWRAGVEAARLINKGKRYGLGYRHTPEAIEKIRVSSAARKYPGRKLSEETKAKIGLAHRGRKLSPEHIAAIRMHNLGSKRSESTKHKLSEAWKTRKNRDQMLQMMRERAREYALIRWRKSAV